MDLGFLPTDSWIFTWIVLPILIFLSRIADQSIGTLRLIFVSKGYKYIAPLLGFFEVIIWLLAVSQILKQMNNYLYYIAYGAGFAAGNFIGLLIEEKLSLGTVIVRIMPRSDSQSLIETLRKNNYGLTTVDGQGSRGPIKIIFLILPRKHLKDLIQLIHQFDPETFYSIEEVKEVRHGILRREPRTIFGKPLLPQLWRKSK